MECFLCTFISIVYLEQKFICLFFFNGLFIMNAFVLKLSCKSFAMHDLHGSINTKMIDRVTIHRNKNITLCTWCAEDANINHRESAARIVVLSCCVID